MRWEITLSPEEQERRRAFFDGQERRAIVSLVVAVDALVDPVRTLMGLSAGPALVLSPDTGPLHISHALRGPVVGLFGHANPWRVGPWQRFHDLLVDRYVEPRHAPDPSGYVPKDSGWTRSR